MKRSLLNPLTCFLLAALAGFVAQVQAQTTTPLSLLWTYDSGTLPDGRTLASVGVVPTVGSDGSVAFSIVVQQGDSSAEQRIYWIDKEQADTDNPVAIFESSWSSDQYQVLAVRLNHLIYAEIDSGASTTDIFSLVRDPGATGVGSPSAATATIASSAVNSMVEQSRGPGVAYVFEGDFGDTSFKVHAFEILPVDTAELLEPTVIGVDSENVTLRFESVADAMYQLERSSDLSTWVTDGDQVVGNGVTLILQRPLPSTGQEFYRLRKL
ncbi:hypothetical protein [Coraliomargarita akajimensis]|uniref:Uncharacterized protein n=1 Tax=Coraliomargarita akajimensis (strain DSM 45221 / IAM 15411 / JCM 23193 / KCTC 12865 / 04OKA010-24) TaxID=583355 RepID=D5ELC4_CORAD|nr:hypothetical protein [Coraliomargarita akajimensis]ADE55060.1 hypothetical protein Caka_2042 [Coraliomargarita akajimensis DSM 45221]